MSGTNRAQSTGQPLGEPFPSISDLFRACLVAWSLTTLAIGILYGAVRWIWVVIEIRPDTTCRAEPVEPAGCRVFEIREQRSVRVIVIRRIVRGDVLATLNAIA